MIGAGAVYSSDKLHKSLLHRWKLDETSDTLYRDVINQNDGIPAGGLVIADDTVQGILGNAVLFDGVLNNIEIPNIINRRTNDFTVSAHIKLSTIGQWNAIISNRNTTKVPYFTVRVSNTNRLELVIRDVGVHVAQAISVSSLLADTWYFITAVRDGINAHVYINGILSKTNTDVDLFDVDTTGIYPRIGVKADNNDGDPMHGIIDDLRVYDKALTVEEINLIM